MQRNRSSLLGSALLPLFLLAGAPARAQTLEPGYAGALYALPATASCTLVLERGIVYFTGTRLVLAEGAAARDLLTFATPMFGSFTIRADRHQLVFGENSSGGIWLVPLTGSAQPRRLATVPFNYDATMWRGYALVSAKTGGFSAPDNDVLAVDLRSGATDAIALVAGASGPLCTDRNDDLLYGTASNSFPPPPGSASVLRWRAAQVAAAFGPTRLGRNDATLVHPGFDAAGDLALDADGDLFVTDWLNQQVLELSDIAASAPRQSLLVDYQGLDFSAGALQFLEASERGPGFEPFQPRGGGSLWIHETRWHDLSQLRAVESAPALTVASPASPIGPGRFAITTSGAAPGGVGFALLGLGHTRDTVAITLPGFEQLLFANAAVVQPLAGFPLVFDARGNAGLGLLNPGLAFRLDLTVQVAFVSRTAPVVGVAPALPLQLF